MVDGRLAQLLQAGEVRVIGLHQGRQVGGLRQMGRQGLVLSLERGVALRREVIVVEVVEIRLGLGGLFGAVQLQQRGGIVRLGHVDQGVVAAVQGVILADGGAAVDIHAGVVIRRHVEHGHGVPAGLGEHVLQTAVRAGGSGGLMDGLGQGLRLGRVADEQGDARGALAAAQVGGVSPRHGGGERRLVAHLGAAGSGHVDQGHAALIVLLAGVQQVPCRAVQSAGILLVKQRQGDTHHFHTVAVMQLHVAPAVIGALTLTGRPVIQPRAAAVDVHHKPRVGIAGIGVIITGQAGIVVGIQLNIGCVVRAQQVCAARCQLQAAVGIQARAAEAGIQGGEVVQVRKRHRHVRGAGQLAIGVFQRFNMGDILRPLSRVIVCIIAVEALEHFPVLGGAAHDAVSHVSL